jgi:hypothetical protein
VRRLIKLVDTPKYKAIVTLAKQNADGQGLVDLQDDALGFQATAEQFELFKLE